MNTSLGVAVGCSGKALLGLPRQRVSEVQQLCCKDYGPADCHIRWGVNSMSKQVRRICNRGVIKLAHWLMGSSPGWIFFVGIIFSTSAGMRIFF